VVVVVWLIICIRGGLISQLEVEEMERIIASRPRELPVLRWRQMKVRVYTPASHREFLDSHWPI
jgi:hypothetical protein